MKLVWHINVNNAHESFPGLKICLGDILGPQAKGKYGHDSDNVSYCILPHRISWMYQNLFFALGKYFVAPEKYGKSRIRVGIFKPESVKLMTGRRAEEDWIKPHNANTRDKNNADAQVWVGTEDSRTAYWMESLNNWGTKSQGGRRYFIGLRYDHCSALMRCTNFDETIYAEQQGTNALLQVGYSTVSWNTNYFLKLSYTWKSLLYLLSLDYYRLFS